MDGQMDGWMDGWTDEAKTHGFCPCLKGQDSIAPDVSPDTWRPAGWQRCSSRDWSPGEPESDQKWPKAQRGRAKTIVSNTPDNGLLRCRFTFSKTDGSVKLIDQQLVPTNQPDGSRRRVYRVCTPLYRQRPAGQAVITRFDKTHLPAASLGIAA